MRLAAAPSLGYFFLGRLLRRMDAVAVTAAADGVFVPTAVYAHA